MIKNLFIFILLCFSICMLKFSFAQSDNNRGLATQSKKKLQLGDVVPDIELPNPYGNLINLNQFRGKIVLINFWASWCKPCRAENLIFNQIFEEYNNSKFVGANGFTILSISLDVNQEKWREAILQDNILWDNHLSELKGVNSELVKKFSVTAIPANFLIDAEGVIIDRNFRAPDLYNILDKLKEP